MRPCSLPNSTGTERVAPTWSPSSTFSPSGRTLTSRALAVTAEAEGRGVGSALLDYCQAWARQRGSDHLTLNALVTNARARAFYERRGFAGEYLRYLLPLK